MLNRVIIVPIDGSHDALKAVKYAAKLAHVFQDKIILLHVQQNVDLSPFQHLVSQDKVLKLQEENASKIFEDAIKILNDLGIEYETKIRSGLPSIEISSEAKEQNARSIIMGTRGMGPALSNALGSVSYSLTHLSPCPLTLIPSVYEE